jgi:hypothetical protein
MIRTPYDCVTTVVISTVGGLLTSDSGVVVAAGTTDRALLYESETLVAGTVTAPSAKTGAGMRTRRTNATIRIQESSFIFSPKAMQHTGVIPHYTPLTSHGFKRIDFYFIRAWPANNDHRWTGSHKPKSLILDLLSYHP